MLVFTDILFTKECDAKPNVRNSAAKDLNINERSGVLLNGSAVQYTCDTNYVTNFSTSTCGEDGVWSPAITCHPGFFIIKLTKLHLYCFCFKQTIQVLRETSSHRPLI